MTNNSENLIPSHGGYRKLASYQMAELAYDLTVEFCKLHISKFSRTTDQMTQAARSGKQNIAEGCMASGTSKKTELKLIGVARASLEELLLDYEDFIRQNKFAFWGKDNVKARAVRALAYRTDKSYLTYKTYLEASAEDFSNTLICIINQANFLLDRQLKTLEKDFLEKGGFTERLYNFRKENRSYK